MSAMIHKWVAASKKPKGKGLGHMEPNPEPEREARIVIDEETGQVSYEFDDIPGTWNRYSEVSVQYHRDNPHEWVTRNMNAPAMYQVPIGYRYGPLNYYYLLTEEEARAELAEDGFTSSEIEKIVNYEDPPLWFTTVFTGLIGLAVIYRVRWILGIFSRK